MDDDNQYPLAQVSDQPMRQIVPVNTGRALVDLHTNVKQEFLAYIFAPLFEQAEACPFFLFGTKSKFIAAEPILDFRFQYHLEINIDDKILYKKGMEMYKEEGFSMKDTRAKFINMINETAKGIINSYVDHIHLLCGTEISHRDTQILNHQLHELTIKFSLTFEKIR
jgi:hypothetical protein